MLIFRFRAERGLYSKVVGATDSSLRAIYVHFRNREGGKWQHFEEVRISQQGKGLLPSSFIIFLLLSRP